MQYKKSVIEGIFKEWIFNKSPIPCGILIRIIVELDDSEDDFDP